MRNFDEYIIEKLKITKNTKIDSFKKLDSSLSNFFKNYCKEKLNWKTSEYIYHIDKSENIGKDRSRVLFHSQKFNNAVDINTVQRNLVIALRGANYDCTDSRIVGNTIYFYFKDEKD